MIIRSTSFKGLVIDSYLHAFIAIGTMSILFMLAQITRYQKDLNSIVSEVFDSINLTNHITKPNKVDTDSRLDSLSKIYDNSKFYNKYIGENVKISLFTQLGILFVTVIMIAIISGRNRKFWYNLLFDKIIFFTILVSLEYIFYETVVRSYQDITFKDVFEILKKNINHLS